MKKIIFSLLAAAALAACTKTDVTYDAPAEIGFAPATKNITKAAMTDGTLGKDEKLGVWAFWNYNESTAAVTDQTGAIGTDNPYTAYSNTYLNDATFVCRTDDGTNWGGGDGTNPVYYPWPTNGALVFAGYTKPTDTPSDFSVAYTLNDNSETQDVDESDVMTFTNFTQSSETSKTYDLCWFGRTASSYNNRSTGDAVNVTLSHALTWITIQVKGKSDTSLPVTASWKITDVTLNKVNTVGTGKCVGTTTTSDGTTTPATATWTSKTPVSMEIYSNSTGQVITKDAANVETEPKGTVIIPQTPVTLTVKWNYEVGSETKTGQADIDLSLDNLKDESGNAITKISTWEAGKHYTYTLVFDSNEILVAPSYSDWATANQTVTVE